MRTALTVTFAALAIATTAAALTTACDDLKPQSANTAPSSRLITGTDLVRLRDIGPTDPTDVRAPILGLSPDGRHVAFQLRRADPVSNGYCFGMFVLSIDGQGTTRLVDQGGDFVPIERNTPLGFAKFTSPGLPILVTPKWSPDSATIAYLRRDGGYTQIWLASEAGRGSRAVTHVSFDIEQFAWIGDGSRLVFSGRPDLVKAQDALAGEGRNGYLFDDRYVPANSSVPLIRDPIAVGVFTVDVEAGVVRAATEEEGRELNISGPAGLPNSTQIYAVSPQKGVAWASAANEADIHSSQVLHVRSPDDQLAEWPLPGAALITNLWWSADEQFLIFMTLEGWGRGWTSDRQGLYIWRKGSAVPREILSTKDVLIGCVITGHDLVCGHESSIQPREIVRISLDDGILTPLFNPNPEFKELRFGPVQHLKWKNSQGLEAFGDLVLPPNHRPGERYPLIVVQYRSRGFLRGGTGDEYPIQLFAANDFAVLSFSHPAPLSDVLPAKTREEADRKAMEGWADRWSIEASLETGVQHAIATGTIDPRRIGLTGLSDGATTAQFALLNSNLFTAVAIGTCCDEPSVTGMLAGPAPARFFQELGYPRLTQPALNFWKNYSLRANTANVKAPILIQTADREYLGALEAYTALKEAGKPIEMYVFPDEYHIKWQPAHRLAAYQRSLDWFKFWLKGEADDDPHKAIQFQRWSVMAVPRAIPNR